MTRHGRARDRVQAVSLVVAAAGTAIAGIWAVITPLGFYRSFPGAGHHWVAMDGPYNRHLVSDVGLLSLALTLTLLVALWKREKVLVRTASVAALVFAAPHLAYHASHLGLERRRDARDGGAGDHGPGATRRADHNVRRTRARRCGAVAKTRWSP